MGNAFCTVNDIAEKIIIEADQNEMGCDDETCILAYSLLRDCGYQIKRVLAEASSRKYDC